MRLKKFLKIRYRLILKYIGVLVAGGGLYLLTPLFSLLFFPGEVNYSLSFVIPALIGIFFGALLYFFNRSSFEVTLNLKEGGVIVVISWLVVILLFSLPFYLTGIADFTGAVFESTSGITTTGLTVVEEDSVPKMFLLWRSLMQLLGGAGLVVVMMAAIINPYGFGMFQAEGREDQLVPHVKRSAKLISTIYISYSLAGIVLYYLAGMNLFDSINHSFAALSTGGFSTSPASIGAWDSLSVELVTILLMLLGGINFATHYVLLKGKYRLFFKNGEIRFSGFVLLFSIPLVSFLGLRGISTAVSEAVRTGSFQVISALTTTGFSTVSLAGWPALAFFTIIILMLIGGGAGSTAGGLKQFRVHALFCVLFSEIKRIVLPDRAVYNTHVWRGEKQVRLDNEQIKEIASFVALYFVTFTVGVLIFLSYGYEIRESLFEFASALGTVGLSTGITGPEAPRGILWTQTAGMFLGRLEFLIIFVSIIKLLSDVRALVRADQL